MLNIISPKKAALSISAAVLLLAPAMPTMAHADDLASLQKQAAEVQAQIDTAQEKLDAASRDYDEALSRESHAREEAEKAEKEKTETEAEIDKLHDRIGERTVYKYKEDPLSVLDMFLSAKSFDDVEKMFTMLDEMDAYDKELTEEQKRLHSQLEEQERSARENEEEARKQKDAADSIKQDAEAEMSNLEYIYDGLSAEVATIIRQQQAAAAYSSAMNGPVSAAGTDWSGVTAPSDANDIVARAYAALGSPYSWGGVGNGGYDCSGLVSYCVSGEHARIGTTSTFMGYEQTSNPEPGDIVTSGSHCGIYIGDGQMIHASDYGTGVIIGNVQSDMIAVKS